MNPLLSLLESTIVSRIGWALVHSLWQIAVVAVVAAVVNLACARQRANVRYLVSCAGMLACIAIPIITCASLHMTPQATASAERNSANGVSAEHDEIGTFFKAESLRDDDSSSTARNVLADIVSPATVAAMPGAEDRKSVRSESSDFAAVPAGQVAGVSGDVPLLKAAAIKLNSWLPVIFSIWIVGVIVLGIRPLAGLLFSRRMRRHGRSPVTQNVSRLMAEACRQLGLNGAIEIAQSTLVEIPSIIGYFKPLVLLPASAVTGLNETQLRAILLHELAHIRRHDYLVNLLQTVIESLLFYHPLVWWMSSQIRIERENCCDDIVLQHCDNRSEYVRALLQLDSHQRHTPVPTLNATGGSLVKRVQRIAGKQNSVAANVWIAGFIVLALIALIPISQSSTWAVQPEQQTEKPETRDHTTIGSRRIRIQVVDDAEKPVANARVEQRIGDEKFSVQTDEAGIADFSLPVEHPAMLSIHIRGDFCPQTVHWENSDDNDRNPIPAGFKFQVSRGRRISGRITDAAGNPVVGAKITPAYSVGAKRSGQAVPDWADWERQTDKNGQWSIDHAPMQLARFDAEVNHPDFANDSIRFDTATVKTHSLTMQAGVTVRGTITDPADRPLANTQVMLTPKFATPGSWMTRTNDLGAYEFNRVKPDEFGLTVIHKDYAPQTVTMKDFRGAQVVDFQLQPGTPMRFRFVDKNGEPVEGVQVTRTNWISGRGIAEFEDVSPAFSDSRGNWVWMHAPNGRVIYEFTKRDCLSSTFWSREPQDQPYEHVVHSVLEISGNVTSKSTGMPIPEFNVFRGNWVAEADRKVSGQNNADENGAIRWDLDDFQSMKNGRYRYRIDETQNKHYIKVEAPGYEPAISQAFYDADEKLSFDFSLENGREVTGVIIDQAGKPIRNAKVFYVLPGRRTEILNSIPDRYGSPILCVSDADGQFALPEQEQVHRIMVIADEGYAYTLQDHTKEKQEFRIEPWATIRGMCMIGDRPAAGEEIWLHLDSYAKYADVSFSCESTVEDDGSFKITRVPPNATYSIGRKITWGRKYGGSMGSMTHVHRITTKPGDVLEVDIGGTGRPLIGKFQLPANTVRKIDDWNDTSGILHRKNDQDDGKFGDVGAYSFVIKIDGTFRVEDLPAGDYRLTKIAVDMQASSDNFEIGRVEEEFTIPEMAGGRSDQPFDLGTIELKLK